MGLLITTEVPTGQGEMIRVETLPLMVEPSPEFEMAKLLLEQMVKSAGSLPNSITTQDDYNKGMKILQGITAFLKNLDAGVKPTKDRINSAKDRLMSLIHELDTPAKSLQLALSRETGRFQIWQAEQTRLEQERLEREAELERQRKQREMDLSVLQAEIELAQQSADEANGRGQLETKNEIDAGIRRLVNALKNAATAALIANPVYEVTGVRQTVALAIQHEQARIAAAQAKAEGDKKRAREIEKAALKLEAPEVEEVYVPQVQAAPIVARRPDLYHAAGSSVSQVWRVKEEDLPGGKKKVVGIRDPRRVAREHPEFCEPSVSLLNDYAARIKTKPDVPGVEWFQDTRTKGVR